MTERYIMMSRRYNRETPEQFDLVPTETPGIYLNVSDGTNWISRYLYDFGVGPEYGFCRFPMPEFEKLLDLLLNSEDEDNRYGAAVILIQEYPEELLSECEDILKDKNSLSKYKDFFRILHLDRPLNRSSIMGKSFAQIEDDFMKWKAISLEVEKVLRFKD